MDRQILSEMIARGICETGIEGTYRSVSRSTAGDYPSLGISQWEGARAEHLLFTIPGGEYFTGKFHSQLSAEGRIGGLMALLDSPAGRLAQQQLLAADAVSYVDALIAVGLSDPRCIIYAGMWCPTSTSVVCAFLQNRRHRGNLDDLPFLHMLFLEEYARAADVMEYETGYRNRAERTYEWVRRLSLA